MDVSARTQARELLNKVPEVTLWFWLIDPPGASPDRNNCGSHRGHRADRASRGAKLYLPGPEENE